MKLLKTVAALLALLMVSSLFIPVAKADSLNQATKVTFNEPVQVPGRVLPPGTYWLMLATTQTNPAVVTIYNANRTEPIALVQTNDAYRGNHTGRSEFVFDRIAPNAPEILVKWFYPGTNTGHAFIYSPEVRNQMEAANDINANAQTVQFG